MSSRSLRLLCTGDVHLGRRPSRVPLTDDELSVRHVWRRFVDTAVDRDVDAVVLTGDLVDRENKMYEAYGALERGIRELLSAKIPVVAVAGNHDYDAFPRLVRSIDDERFHLLGQGGQWESVSLPLDGADVQFVGWSFPEATVTTSPLEALDLSVQDGPTVGVLHAEAGRTEGRYAPVPRDALARAPVDAWLLGHIHAPNEHWEQRQLHLYPGSLQPLDPGEPGAHGAWLVEIASGEVNAQAVSLATLRYEPVTVDVSGRETAEDVETATLEAIRDRLTDLQASHPTLRHVAVRLIYEGRTQLHDAIEAQARGMVEDLQPEVDDLTATVEAFELRARPDYDLESLAEGHDPAGVLARLLLDLEEGRESTEIADLLRRVDKAVGSVHASSGYEPLRRDAETQDAPSRDELRTLLRRQGYRLLDELHGAG